MARINEKKVAMIIELCDGDLMSVSKKTYKTRNNEKEQVRESLIKSSPSVKDYKNSKSHNVS